jgi:hypothetical protein
LLEVYVRKVVYFWHLITKHLEDTENNYLDKELKIQNYFYRFCESVIQNTTQCFAKILFARKKMTLEFTTLRIIKIANRFKAFKPKDLVSNN